MIDTHSHLYEPDFDTDRDAVIERARLAGVQHILLPNINAGSVEPMLDMCRQHPDYCFPMLGLHPTDVNKTDYLRVLDHMAALLEDNGHPYIAIGEVGLDYYWDSSNAAEQEKAFRIQIEWAIRHRLPLMIHARSAHRQLVTAISEYSGEHITGVFHCFGGTTEEALELLQFQGFALGIGGVVTYKKSPLPETLRHVVPLDRIVLETDAPYLSPVPHRGKRNESAFIVATLHKIADIYGISPQAVEKATNDNVKRLFPRVKPSQTKENT